MLHMHGVRSGIMTSYQIMAIEAFDLSSLTEWTNWIHLFEWFWKDSGRPKSYETVKERFDANIHVSREGTRIEAVKSVWFTE